VTAANELQQLYRILLSSYRDFLGITPLEFDDFDLIIGRYLKALDARFVTLVDDSMGNLAAFSVAYPDYSAVLRRAYPPAKPQDRSQPSEAARIVFYMIGATPKEVERRHGLGSATLYHTVRQILGAGFRSIIFAIIADDSGVRGLLGEEMRIAQRSYALYELNR
jgi:hypothetical protein